MYRYVAVKESGWLPDCGSYTTYGIYAYEKEGKEPVAVISDISLDREAVQKLAERCTSEQLVPYQLLDVAEDFLI